MTQEMMSREELQRFIDHVTLPGSARKLRPEFQEHLIKIGFTALAYHDQKEINKELYEALGELVGLWEDFQNSHGNQEQAYYRLAKGKYDKWDKAIVVLAKARGETND